MTAPNIPDLRRQADDAKHSTAGAAFTIVRYLNLRYPTDDAQLNRLLDRHRVHNNDWNARIEALHHALHEADDTPKPQEKRS